MTKRARHQGVNSYCTDIGNEWFAWFETTSQKNRINFLELLRGQRTDYVLVPEALTYMAEQKLPSVFMATSELVDEPSL